MIFRAFRVQMYKSILDSGWIDVPQLTVIVGKNESGKTTLLKALHKFRPFNDEPYKMSHEWPRGRRREQNERQVVCTVRFDLSEEERAGLLAATEQTVDARTVEVTRDFGGQYGVRLAEGSPVAPGSHEKAVAFVVERLPTFIYMDDYKAFTGTARLDEVKARKQQNRLTEEDKTLMMILELSGLDLESEFRKGGEADREQRQYDLDDAAKTLSRDIANRWKQRKYEVEFRADGHQFFTMVQDDTNVGLIRLEERSKGFQWFFSFDLMFMHESQGTFKGCVILLDEPGLHLHPEGQRDLLDRLEAYAKGNVLIYTTHLPFMIDLRHPDRIKIISESSQGAVVTENLTDTAADSKLTLQAALGMSGRTSFLLAQQNLVVEGVDDAWILSELSNLLVRSGADGLPDDLFVTAAGGASEAGYIATFMIGQRLDVVVLLDSDKAGDDARDKLVKTWLTRYNGSNSQVLSLGAIVGAGPRPFGIEDLFSDEFYLGRVREAYSRELAAIGSPELRLQGDDCLWKRTERALEAVGIKFNKGRVAKLLRRSLSRMSSSDGLSSTTKDAATKIVAAVRAALPKPGT